MAGGGPAAGGAGKRAAEYKGHFNFNVFIAAVVAASGGLLFGWDIGVTGGVETFNSYKQRFFPHLVEGHSTDPYCAYDDALLQLFTASLFLSGAVSSLFAGHITKKYGRRVTIAWGAFIFLAGTVLQAAAYELAQLIIGRLVLGVAIGLINQAVPLFLSEMAPFNLRGALNIMFQLCTTIGILAAQLVNYRMGQIDEDWNWRISVGSVGVLAVFMGVGTLILNDSPNGLIERGLLEEGKRVLRHVRGVEDVEAEFLDIVEAAEAANAVVNPWRTILQRRYLPQLTIAVLIPLFQQLTGINSIMFYSPQILQAVFSEGDTALLNTVIIGAINVGSTFVAIAVVDRFGRKALFWQGGAQMFATLVACAGLIGAGFQQYGEKLPESWGAGILFCICMFVAGFAWSWGPLGWLVPSEIQPLEVRSAGLSISVCVNFLMSFLIGQSFNSMLCAMQYGVFLFFGMFVLIMTIFVTLCLPETKGVPIEEVDQLFAKHWLWGKVLAEEGIEGGPPAKSDPSSVEKGAASSAGSKEFRRRSQKDPHAALGETL
mmetsp:Transcript_28770/g.63386  ORF Transcript_28770/g.63386 Transcript_28770/m.63386 type:complete len:544 (+) Transcript_28770:163-1794(+)